MFSTIVLFPAWLEALARALPFASMIQLPAEVFLGKHEGLDLLRVFLVQVAWLAALLAVAAGSCWPGPCGSWWWSVADCRGGRGREVADGVPFARLRASLTVYRRLVGARMRADWQYRTSFFLFLAGQTRWRSPTSS